MYAFETIVSQADLSVRLLIVQAAIGQTLAEVLETVRTDHDGEDPVIVRLPVEFQIDPSIWSDPENAKALEVMGNLSRLKGRTRNRSLHVLSSFEGRPYVSPAVNGPQVPDELAGFERSALLTQLREAEFKHMVQRSKALLTAPPESVFQAPSGYVVHNFVRVGNIQADRDALDAVAFWMLEHLADRDAIVIDTWSISSIAFNSARIAGDYYSRVPPRVEMLPGYNDGSDGAMIQAGRILERAAADVGRLAEEEFKVLILISATQTGSLVEVLQQVCDQAGRTIAPKFLALFALRASSVARLSDFVDDTRFAFEPAKASDLAVVEIDPQVYFPLTYVDVPYRLAKADAQRHRDFFDAYRRTKVVKVHADEIRTESGGAHHAIRLDLLEILGTHRFTTRLKDLLKDLGPQKAILAPGHAAAQSLAKAIASMLPSQSPPTPILPLPSSTVQAPVGARAKTSEMLHEAASGDEFIIVDDFNVDPAQIAQTDKLLRTMEFAGRVHYVIGILANSDPEEWTGFSGRLTRRGSALPPHTVNAVEQLPLPDLGRDGCPWCAELNVYDGWLLRGEPLPPLLEERRALLAGAGKGGLTDDALLHPGHLPPPTLGPRSFFVKTGASHAHVFAAAAAALQTLRTTAQEGKPKLGPRHFPIATILHHEDYLTQKWTDTVLRAAFLRAGTKDELVWTQTENRDSRMRALTGLLRRNDAAEHDVVLEILIAAACGKVELDLDDERLSAIIGSRTPDGSAGYMIKRLQEDRFRPARTIRRPF